jgi:hypothetical protein
MMGRDSSVGIALATGWTVRGSSPGGGARFFESVHIGAWAHPASYTISTKSLPTGRIIMWKLRIEVYLRR